MNDDPIAQRINELRKQRRAIILAHNYQHPEVQDIADFTGDSLELSRKARDADCEVIVFCGVRFMAETAHILNPTRTVLMPDPKAGCPLAAMVGLEELRKLKREHPDAIVVCYVNTDAEVKAESDVVCTSANSTKIVTALKAEGRPIIFVPDVHLGEYTARKTGVELILAPGYCPTHRHIMIEDILELKKEMPDAVVIVHPECTTDVVDVADHVCSTSQMKKAVAQSSAKRFIIGTEVGMLHPLRKEHPDREFFVPSKRSVCPNMKKTTLEKVMWSLESLEHKIEIEPEIAKKALRAIEKMLEYV